MRVDKDSYFEQKFPAIYYDMRRSNISLFAIHGVGTIYGGKVLHLNGIFSEI